MKILKKILTKIFYYISIFIAFIISLFRGNKETKKKIINKKHTRVVNTTKVTSVGSNDTRDSATIAFNSETDLEKVELKLEQYKEEIKIYYETNEIEDTDVNESKVIFDHPLVVDKDVLKEEAIVKVENIENFIKEQKQEIKEDTLELIDKIIDEGFVNHPPHKQVVKLEQVVKKEGYKETKENKEEKQEVKENKTELQEEEPTIVEENKNIKKELVKEVKKEKVKDEEIVIDNSYVITTTKIIEKIIKRLKDIKEDFAIDKNLDRVEEKAKDIKKQVLELLEIYNTRDVQELIRKLKYDHDTKKEDKYDILFNDEIFKNIINECDGILNIRRERKEAKKEEKKKEKEEKKKEETKEKQKTKEERIKEQAEEQQKINIRKRFEDLFLANQLLEQDVLLKKDPDLVTFLRTNYFLFGMADKHAFNFERNRNKYEVVRLFNNLVYASSVLDGAPYEPLLHINVNYRELLLNTMELQAHIDKRVHKVYGEVHLGDQSSVVLDKLYGYYEKEVEREIARGIVQPKVLKRTFKNE